MEVQVKITGLKPFTQDFLKRVQRLNNLTPAFKRAVTLYHAWIIKNFNAQGRLHSRSSLHWQPLKDSTIRRRRKKGGGAKILMDTGALRRDWDLLSSSKYGIIRSQHAYSGVHEDGAVIRVKSSNTSTRKGKKNTINIPQRKIFPEHDQGQEIILPAFDQHIFGSKG